MVAINKRDILRISMANNILSAQAMRRLISRPSGIIQAAFWCCLHGEILDELTKCVLKYELF
jgi:hypothetical protein